MTSPRALAIAWAAEQIGKDVLMGYRGELRFDRATRTLVPHGLGILVFDCSGFVTRAIKEGGGPDLSGTHNAQLLAGAMPELPAGTGVLPADCGFYGSSWDKVEHIVLCTAGGSCLSADGATWGITSLEVARASRCRVRLHTTLRFRGDFLGVRRNVFLDAIPLGPPT